MRNIITISVPSAVKKQVDLIVKENNYASTSEFFRDTIRAWEGQDLYNSVVQSEREFALGKGKKLRSLKDLM